MLNGKCLVIGASGFLGGHTTKQLVAQGNDVRILVRESADTIATDHLQNIERLYGSCFDPETLRAALQGVSYVFYCVVDARSFLRDTAPLWKTNVENLKVVLEEVVQHPLEKFIFTSTLATIGINPSGVATEADLLTDWEDAPEYTQTRLEAERLVLRYCNEHGLPGVAMCVSNTYGIEDYQPTPHGKIIWNAATGAMPVYFPGGIESVDVVDAAKAMVLAAAKGRCGQRYIISEKYLTIKQTIALGAQAGGRKAPRLGVPLPLFWLICATIEFVSLILPVDKHLGFSSWKMLTKMPRMDCSKARRELGWQPRPVEEAIADAVASYKKILKK
jgi:dihydroflavonol-4-reductase